MATIFLLAVATYLPIASLDPPALGRPPIGSVVADVPLGTDQGGIHDPAKGSKDRFVCVVFLRVGCPVAELYPTTLNALARRFESTGVRFVGVSAGAGDDPAKLALYASEHGLAFPFLPVGVELAERLGATRTPEVVVLDDRRRIRYRGRIDDRYSVGSRRLEARHHDLVDALEALVGGREVGQPETQAVGCPIDRPLAQPSPTKVTYSREIASLLDRRCVSCHRPGQIGPFSLATYPGAASRASSIAEAVEDGRMPPWHASPAHGQFANDARLTDEEKKQVLDWVEGGCPEGNPADLPRPIDRPDGWTIPRPDLVVSMPEPFHVPAEGVVDYQFFEVDPGFEQDRWVEAAEIREGNRKVVHHCTVFLKPPGGGREPELQGDLGSYCMATKTPGSPAMVLPPGMAKRIPKGWRLLFVVHYSPIGKPEVDRTSIGLRFAAPNSVKQEVATNLLYDPDLRIPPRQANHRVERSRRFEGDVLLLSMFPHMHVRGKSFTYQAIFPDGRIETLLDVPRYDFHWQNRYELAEPRRLPAGTTLRCVAHFDNSPNNPANPNPSATVLAGQQSWDEMFNGYYDFALADQDLIHPPTTLETLRATSKRQALPLSVLGAVSATTLLVIRWKKRNRD